VPEVSRDDDGSPVSSASTRAEAPASAESDRRPSLLLIHHLGARQVAAARRALAAGGEVACLSADPVLAAALGGAVRVLPPGALPDFQEGAEVEASFDLAELAVEELLRRRPQIARRLARIAGSEHVDRYLCRSLLREVGDFLALVILVASPELAAHGRIVVERHWPNGLDFAFLTEVAQRRGLTLQPPLGAALDRISFAAEARLAGRRRATTAALAARELADLWGEWLRRLRPAASALPARPLLIRSYDADWGLDIGGQRRLRNLDFVVDAETIRPEETAVWAEEGVPAERDAALAERGYAVLRRAAVTMGPFGFARRVLPALVTATGLFVRLAAAERWWQQPVRTLVSESLLWGEVGRRVRPRVLLALNDLLPSGVARTLALRRAGCLTVDYEFSSHWRAGERAWIPDYVYGFTVVDAMVTWGPLHSRHFRNHRGAIGECWEVGCLWSEHARLVAEDPQFHGYYRAAIERAHGLSLDGFERIVGVFDTTVASDMSVADVLRYDDLLAFYAGVAGLARRLPRVLFLCKPKRAAETVFAKTIGSREVGTALAAAPNVAVLDNFFETAAVVGLCDLSVNACFTSPAVETIGAGKPALYFDPTGRIPRAFFRAIPGFVAADEEELAVLVQRLLDLDAGERAADLRARFAQLEGHFDGRAISRLRERLRAALDD
jgi:polysaccharide biosynthesis PFTS motif protein